MLYDIVFDNRIDSLFRRSSEDRNRRLYNSEQIN